MSKKKEKTLEEKLESLRKRSDDMAKASAQGAGAILLIIGLIMLFVAWPIGLIIIIVAILMAK